MQKEYNLELNKLFNNCRFTVRNARHYGADLNELELTIVVKVDANEWNTLKRQKKDPIDCMRLVVGLSNFLYRSTGLAVKTPYIGGMSKRAKNGIKELEFTYYINSEQLIHLGIKKPEKMFSFHHTGNLWPIKQRILGIVG